MRSTVPHLLILLVFCCWSTRLSGLDSLFNFGERVLVIKGDHFYPPYEFINEMGEPDGFNVDLFKALADELGLNYRLELTQWSEVKEQFLRGEIDVVTGMMVSAARADYVLFGTPHNVMTHGVFTHKSKRVDSIEDLRDKDVIVQDGDMMHEYLIKHSLTNKIIVVPSIREALELLEDGFHDAALLGNYQGEYLIKKLGIRGVVLCTSNIQPQRYAMAVQKDDKELIWLLNAGLYQLKVNGTYDALHEKWFGIYENYYYIKKATPYIIALVVFIFILTLFLFSLRLQVKRAVFRQRSSEKKLFAVAQVSPIGLGIIKGNRFVEVSRRFCEMTGYKKEELEGSPFRDVFSTEEEYSKSFTTLMNRIEESGNCTLDCRIQNKQGVLMDVILTGGAISRFNENEGIIFTITDVTEQNRKNEILRQAGERLRLQIENTPLVVLELDKHMRVTKWSGQAESVFGWTEGYMINKKLEDIKFVFEDDFPVVHDSLQRLLKGIQDRSIVINRSYASDGRILDCEWYNSILKDDKGVPVSIFCLGNNITELRKAEQKIKHERQRLRGIIEGSGVGTWEWNLQTGEIIYNVTYATMLGYEPEEFSPATFEMWKNIVHPDDYEKAMTLIDRHLENQGVKYEIECRLKHKDGHWVTALDKGRIIAYTPNKTPLIMAGTLTDLTMIKEANIQILQNEKRLKSMLALLQKDTAGVQELLDFAIDEATNIAACSIGYILIYDEAQKHFHIKAWSKNVREAYLMGDGTMERVEASDAGLWKEAVTQQKPLVLNNLEEDYKFGVGLSENHVRLNNYLAVPVISNSQIVMVVGLVNKESSFSDTDVMQVTLLMDSIWRIIEKKKADLMILKLSVVTEQSPASVIITDVNGNIEYVNNRHMSISGYDNNELHGSLLRILNPDHNPDEYNGILNTLKSGNSWRGEYQNQRKSGEKYWEVALISPIRNELGDITNFVMVSEDITESKLINIELVESKNKAEENDKLKTAFLNNLSHEVRTPLNAIVGFSELITMNSLSEEKRGLYALTIFRSSKQLLSLMENIIAISMIEAGQIKLSEGSSSIMQILKDVYNQLFIIAGKSPVALEFYSKLSDSQDSVFLDQTKVIQILSNLVGNALKFTKKGYVKFGCEVREGYLHFLVEDSGEGIEDDLKDVIFERFTQGPNSPSGLQEGMGLGLSIVKSYVDIMGGSLSLASIPGQGTTISVKLPFKAMSKDSINDNEQTVKSGILSQKTILVVDDVEINHYVIQEMLSDQPVNLLYARNGLEAIEKVKSIEDIALVFMDIKMPGMDGYTTTMKLKEIRSNLIIIAQTAYALAGDKDKSLKAGCDDYVAKPISKKLLLALLDKYL
jgi:two-component system, sensor histidine kinase and response regulator